MAGDSTMAPEGGKNGTEGWGQYLHYSLSIPVVNKAFAGRSARSFTREGRFAAIEALLKKGDFVIIEFGHNDGGSVSPTDNGRSDCAGTGSETCSTVYDGVAETVHTFPWYLESAARNFTAKGATVIISSQTPNNPWESGSFVYSAPRFVEYAQLAANTSKVAYIDHFSYTNSFYQTRTAAQVDAWFPMDHTHTAPKGAALVAQAFVRGLVCGESKLKSYVVNATKTIEGHCL
ncbi:Rhamnogalacturonan acetylesterase [Taxawa tesnikishii (nom. ined.)]|nr:Rhamnogalacturonan acetylesterase [Dothideales sp. JES 119]